MIRFLLKTRLNLARKIRVLGNKYNRLLAKQQKLCDKIAILDDKLSVIEDHMNTLIERSEHLRRLEIELIDNNSIEVDEDDNPDENE